MSYIKELFKDEDQERIGIDALVNKHFSRRKPAYWVIDRETGNYSVVIFSDRPDHGYRDQEKDYIFSWQGHVFDCFTIKWSQEPGRGSTYYWWFVVKPELPTELESFRQEIIDDFCKSKAIHNQSFGYATQFLTEPKERNQFGLHLTSVSRIIKDSDRAKLAK